MTEKAIPVNDTGQDQTLTFSRAMIVEMLSKKFEKLPETDRKMITNGPMYLAVNAGVAGLIANSLYRRTLHVTQARFSSNLPMAVLPLLTTGVLYTAVVTNPLMSGDLNCPTCVLMRGALVGLIGGGLYPILLALPVNAGLSTLYKSTPMPEKGNVVRFWVNLSKPVVKRMTFVFVLQGGLGLFLASKHFEIYQKMLKLKDDDQIYV